jgi:hypothetical protein
VQRLSTTVVALVGLGPPGPPHAPSPLAGLVEAVGAATNVHGVVAAEADATGRAVAAWAAARRSRRTYVVHDADPLEAVMDAWIERFDVGEPPGRLETAVADVVGRWRGQALELPDFYLVLGAADLPATRRHWYLGFLRSHAPHRVVLVDPDVAAIERALGHLPAGRWWPDLPGLLEGVERVVPDAQDTAEREPSEEGGRLIVRGGGAGGA